MKPTRKPPPVQVIPTPPDPRYAVAPEDVEHCFGALRPGQYPFPPASCAAGKQGEQQ